MAGLVALRMFSSNAGPAWFVDGFHGGVYGHYPAGYTAFLVEQLKKHPDWKVNLEIEPATWDEVRLSEPEAYAEFRKLMEDQSDAGRIEIVNPGYGQSYLFQSSGESVIRQLDYGMRQIRRHFPNAAFTTYSSEEPCFTSCLPAVLKSFGFEFASLKNPDTCWGGYTSAHGGELVNWIGPDGSSILAVPRYSSEALQPNSCWQTIAFRNAPEYLAACRAQGIAHPVGMCLQDAGWRGGPWLGKGGRDPRNPTRYVTWREYIRQVTPGRTTDDWHFSQEDVRPGLMWGAQALQRIAQQSRRAEHRLLVAEKLAALTLLEAGRPAQQPAFDEAWQGVLLSQHHDCWIVPYNGRPGNTWIDQARRWTQTANAISDLSVQSSVATLLNEEPVRGRRLARLFNPTGSALDTVVPIPIRGTERFAGVTTVDAQGRRFATQVVAGLTTGQSALLVRAHVPPMGYATVELREDPKADEPPVKTEEMTSRSDPKGGGNAADPGVIVLESDYYRIEFDPAHGGTIRSLKAKKLGNREFVDEANSRRFNEMRGHFYALGGFRSSADQPANINIRETGPLRATVEISGSLAGHPFRQRVSIAQGSAIIDCSVRIDWQGNPRIGEAEEKDGFKNRRRAAYDDRFKLAILFPAHLADGRIAKDAPYDVCESQLRDTFYNSWEQIKNNVILNWADLAESTGAYGVALFSDHTTSYTHGPDFPLGLTLQYSGIGLWGRDYAIDGPTEVHYALLPHAGRWDQAGIPAAAASWREPVLGEFARGGPIATRTMLDPRASGWEIPAVFERDDALFVRLFNGSGPEAPGELILGFDSARIDLVELSGKEVESLTPKLSGAGQRSIQLRIPRFGIRTLRFSGLRPGSAATSR